jgi:cellulose biosynthesis protein BcsQ
MKRIVFMDDDLGGIIQIANIKGGVGKSTVATNLAACFAKRGPALLVDLDVQGSSTTAFGLDPAKVQKSSYDITTPQVRIKKGDYLACRAYKVRPGHHSCKFQTVQQDRKKGNQKPAL